MSVHAIIFLQYRYRMLMQHCIRPGLLTFMPTVMFCLVFDSWPSLHALREQIVHSVVSAVVSSLAANLAFCLRS